MLRGTHVPGSLDHESLPHNGLELKPVAFFFPFMTFCQKTQLNMNSSAWIVTLHCWKYGTWQIYS